MEEKALNWVYAFSVMAMPPFLRLYNQEGGSPVSQHAPIPSLFPRRDLWRTAWKVWMPLVFATPGVLYSYASPYLDFLITCMALPMPCYCVSVSSAHVDTCLSLDSKLIGCSETSVLCWVQEKLRFYSLSRIFLLLVWKQCSFQLSTSEAQVKFLVHRSTLNNWTTPARLPVNS